MSKDNVDTNKLTKTNQVECHAHSPLPDIATAIFGPANWVTDLIEVIINKQTNYHKQTNKQRNRLTG